MKRNYKLSLHVFRRDLRLQDNTSLIEALRSSEIVIPCFIFDKRQLVNNPYKSDHAIQFMLRSLQELDESLRQLKSRLYFFSGIAEVIIKQLLATSKIEAVFINRDYTPFSKARDHQIKTICHHHNVSFFSHADALLHEPEEISKKDGQPYTIFTPFFHKATQSEPTGIKNNTYRNYCTRPIPLEDKLTFKYLMNTYKDNTHLINQGGRKEALSLLKKVKRLNHYDQSRNLPSIQGTSRLSAHLKFGTISVREFYHLIIKNFGLGHGLIKELYWRDFFTHIAFHFPHVFGQSFQPQYNKLKWSALKTHFHAWCRGNTGFPIVDAGMRELNNTGYMHNRVRMIVASFLVKDLHINWQLGEKYFAQQLTDYDPCLNNGNWQWVASTGCDAQPYFRIFNPWIQQQKFDPECLYIKRWVPELVALSPTTIHTLFKSNNNNNVKSLYPAPIVNHKDEIQHTKLFYQRCNV